MKLFTTEKMDEFVQREFIYKYNLVPGFDIKEFWNEKLDFELRPVQTLKKTQFNNEFGFAFDFEDERKILYYIDKKLGKNNLDENDIITGNRYIRVKLASAINTLMCYYSRIEQEKNNLDYVIYDSEKLKKLYTSDTIEDILFAESLLLPKNYLADVICNSSNISFEELEDKFDVSFPLVYCRCKNLKLIR